MPSSIELVSRIPSIDVVVNVSPESFFLVPDDRLCWSYSTDYYRKSSDVIKLGKVYNMKALDECRHLGRSLSIDEKGRGLILLIGDIVEMRWSSSSNGKIRNAFEYE